MEGVWVSKSHFPQIHRACVIRMWLVCFSE